MCNEDIEDEYNCVCVCSEYEEERQILCHELSIKNRIFTALSPEEKSIYMLNFGSKEVVHFINKSWTNRIKKLYNTR
jgi:hypothetical protein